MNCVDCTERVARSLRLCSIARAWCEHHHILCVPYAEQSTTLTTLRTGEPGWLSASSGKKFAGFDLHGGSIVFSNAGSLRIFPFAGTAWKYTQFRENQPWLSAGRKLGIG